jgi:23S rRNA (cytosine1962-C5)-methyltransferase
MQDFKDRLIKMAKHTGKWARRQQISCYRIYDCDIPGYPFSVDKYQDALYVSYFHKSTERTAEEQTDWMDQCLSTIVEALEVDSSLLFTKERKRQKGKEQYEKVDQVGHVFTVQENGLLFEVNLSDYLDTGLFLDHRNTRMMVREASDGKKVLNLFAYTGSFTVYAAAGGASMTKTIDLSNTYLKWAERNLHLNTISKYASHVFHQADVLQYLSVPDDHLYDIIVCDPPTFSNSKRMDSVLDTQRDHGFLIKRCLERLDKEGTLYFSTNYRGFKLDEDLMSIANIKEISHLTVPQDFRNKKIHRCFLVRHY